MSRVKCTSELFTATAVAMSVTFPDKCVLKRILVGFSAAPTTSEDFTVTLDSANGATHDVLLKTVDPVSEGVTDSFDLQFTEAEGSFVYNDGIDIAYTNTDAATITVSVYYEVQP